VADSGRFQAFGRRPQDFFRESWNVFDFVVIMAVFVPAGHRAKPRVMRPSTRGMGR
jgi:hypothetical protein